MCKSVVQHGREGLLLGRRLLGIDVRWKRAMSDIEFRRRLIIDAELEHPFFSFLSFLFSYLFFREKFEEVRLKTNPPRLLALQLELFEV